METHRASEALSGLSENRDGNPTLYNSAVAYQCGQCGSSTPFDIKGKTARADLAEAFEAATGPLQPYEEDYCDFDCAGCGVHVRCVSARTEVRMAQYEYSPFPLYVSPATGRPSIEPESPEPTKGKGCMYVALALGGIIAALVFAGL